jgi:hypothetical protein
VPLFPILLGTVIVLGSLHMIAPDHWVPLTVVSNRLNYRKGKIFGTAAMLGALHALTSEAIAGVALLIGVFLVRQYITYLEAASVILLVAVGVYFILNGYTEDEPESGYATSSVKSILAISAFPDFALIPIVLAASSLSPLNVAWLLLAFIIISAASLTIMVYVSTVGLSRALENIRPRYIDYIMGIILFITAGIIVFLTF